MVILLQSGLPLGQDFRNRLAALFDPDFDPDDNTHPAIDRKLIFRKRPKGHPRNCVRDSAIAEFIRNDIRASHGEGDTIQKATDHFGMGRKAIEKIWYGNKNRPGYQKTFERVYGPLPEQKRGPKKNHLL